MNFYVVKRSSKKPPQKATYPCAILIRDNWDDYGFKTSWDVVVYKNKKTIVMEGLVKILQRSEDNEEIPSTKIPESFTELDEVYCSLGQTMEYYEKLSIAGSKVFDPFLKGMRDATYSPDIAQQFLNVRGFTNSLLRWSEAEKALKEARSLFNPSPLNRVFKFRFRCKVAGADLSHQVDFDFSQRENDLHRTTVIIGKNGTGKTQFLARFAMAMSGWAKTGVKFIPNRPSFNRVIAVSYSAFDNFVRPSEKLERFSYKYCGIRAPNADKAQAKEGKLTRAAPKASSLLTPRQIKARLISAKECIQESGREANWKEILTILLEGIPGEILTDSSLADLSFFDQLSSGQRILVAVTTEVIAHMKENSIVLFDEPEMHLHPTVFSALARTLDKLLKDFDSFAIIATHSPQLLQESFSRQVRIFRRFGSTPEVAGLAIECFGENLAAIVREVFGVDSEGLNFKSHLDMLLESHTVKQVEAMFPLGLPLQAKAYLLAHSGEARK